VSRDNEEVTNDGSDGAIYYSNNEDEQNVLSMVGPIKKPETDGALLDISNAVKDYVNTNLPEFIGKYNYISVYLNGKFILIYSKDIPPPYLSMDDNDPSGTFSYM
jgi:hypothetical protein